MSTVRLLIYHPSCLPGRGREERASERNEKDGRRKRLGEGEGKRRIPGKPSKPCSSSLHIPTAVSFHCRVLFWLASILHASPIAQRLGETFWWFGHPSSLLRTSRASQYFPFRFELVRVGRLYSWPLFLKLRRVLFPIPSARCYFRNC